MDPSPPTLSEEDWVALLSSSAGIQITKPTVLVKQGKASTSLYRMMSGALHIDKESEEDKKKTIRVKTLTEPGTIVGEVAVLGNMTKASATITADAGTYLYQVTSEQLFNVFQENPQLALKFFTFTGYKLATLLNEISSVSNKNAESLRNNFKTKERIEAKFNSIFQLNDESLLHTYSNVTYHWKKGTLYITNNFICFAAKIFGHYSTEIVPIHGSSPSLKKSSPKSSFIVNSGDKSYKFVVPVEDADEISSLVTDLISKSKANVPFYHKISGGGILAPEEWELILSGDTSCLMNFFAGELIRKEGNHYSFICQIASGSCRVEKNIEGQANVILGTLKTGEILGELQFFTGRAATANVVAETDVEIYVLNCDFIRSLFDSHPHVVVNFYRFLCNMISQRIVKREQEGWRR